MENMFEGFDIPPEKLPERPLECGECKKPIAVQYTEIVGAAVVHNCMCADCPVLQRKLYGDRPLVGADGAPLDSGTELMCGNCGTTLEAVRVGGGLGCSVCYDVFEEILLSELVSMEKLPARLATTKKSQLLHQGRVRGEALEISPSMRLLALNEALNEMLQKEDYEQAARLRDQIKALTDQQQNKEQPNEEFNGKQ
jgi:protein arginine kinase activator